MITNNTLALKLSPYQSFGLSSRNSLLLHCFVLLNGPLYRFGKERKLWEEHGIEKLSDLPVFYDSYLDFNTLLMVAQDGMCVLYEK